MILQFMFRKLRERKPVDYRELSESNVGLDPDNTNTVLKISNLHDHTTVQNLSIPVYEDSFSSIDSSAAVLDQNHGEFRFISPIINASKMNDGNKKSSGTPTGIPKVAPSSTPQVNEPNTEMSNLSRQMNETRTKCILKSDENVELIN